MQKKYQIYLVSDSTGETLDRIFLAIQAQFSNFKYEINHYFFIRTTSQIDKLLSQQDTKNNFIILYTIVDRNLSKYLSNICKEKRLP